MNRIHVYHRLVQHAFVEIDGEEFDLHEVLDAMSELDGACFAFSEVRIANPRLARTLVHMDVARPSFRGCYYRGASFDDFMSDLEVYLEVA